MAPKELTLAVAAFLDSPASLTLRAPDTDGQRRLVTAFLEACYLDLGTAPKHLDGDSMEEAFGRRLPARLRAKDPLAPHAALVVEAFLDHLKSRETVPFAFEATLALHRSEDTFQANVANAKLPRHSNQQTVTHSAQKVGRNDPCWCGSA
jgi:hypothetical protein